MVAQKVAAAAVAPPLSLPFPFLLLPLPFCYQVPFSHPFSPPESTAPPMSTLHPPILGKLRYDDLGSLVKGHCC